MKSKDLRTLLLKLNNYLIRQIDTATGLGIKRNHYEIMMEHILFVVLEDDQGDVPLILKHYGVNAGDLQQLVHQNLDAMDSGNPGKPRLSPLLTDLLQEAWLASSLHHKEDKIRSGTLFDVYISSEQVVNNGFMDVLSPINQEDLRANFFNIVSGSVEASSSGMETVSAETARTMPADATILDLYATNLTEQAKNGKIDTILGRDDEILQMIEILSRRRKSNPILLGEPGVGKTAVVEGLALKIALGQVPDALKQVQVLSLDLGALQAGTKMRGEFEKRLKAVLNEVMDSDRNIFLFIDEAHTLIGAGGSAGGGDAANLLKPALARGEIKAIAATTYLEYNKYFAKDAALERRFQPIHVGEPDDDQATLMLRGIKASFEKYHGIHITDMATSAAVKLSRRYIAGRQLPDKAVDLLDTAATRVKMSLTSRPPLLSQLGSRLHALSLAIESMQKDAALNISGNGEDRKAMEAEKLQLEKELADSEARWKQEVELVEKIREHRKKRLADETSDADRKKLLTELQKLEKELNKIQGDSPQVFTDVTAMTIAQVIESWTGIQVGNMTQDEMTTLLQLEEELQKRVVGQDHAIKQIADVIRGAKIGLKNEESPIGVFMLIGTSGVGKTELSRAVAEVLFGDERFMVTLNMTEYQNEHNTSRLIGADPGLVGYGEGGALSEPVRRRPYTVVLLDEIEKANPAVIDIFMQVFDRGMLQDADRRQIDFSNTLIFMTSNVASDVLFEHYSKGTTDPDALLDILRPYMHQYFRPEFLGRLKPVVFLPLAAEVMTKIVKIKLAKVQRLLKKNRGMELQFHENVISDIVAACTRAETGARNIDAIVDRRLKPEISQKLLGFMADGKSPEKVTVGRGKNGGFTFDFV